MHIYIYHQRGQNSHKYNIAQDLLHMQQFQQLLKKWVRCDKPKTTSKSCLQSSLVCEYCLLTSLVCFQLVTVQTCYLVNDVLKLKLNTPQCLYANQLKIEPFLFF